MGKIIRKNLKDSIDQNNEILKYFIEEKKESTKQNYSDIINKFDIAENMICIATTGLLHADIIESLYNIITNGVRVYIILKSFQAAKDVLVKFDKKKPALLREVPELENDFIIVDSAATLYLNCLGDKKNIGIEFDKDFSNDLYYWFNYYFWNKAKAEKILDKIEKPMESPYPPFENEKENINIGIASRLEECEAVIVPSDEKYREINEQVSNYFYFSKDLSSSLYFIGGKTVIGAFEINRNFFQNIGQTWLLKENLLSKININDDIVPFEVKWDKVINIQEQSTILLENVRSSSIEGMDQTKPNTIPQKPYVKKLHFEWIVLPPVKPVNANKASLYQDYSTIQKKFTEDLVRLKRVVIEIQLNNSPVIQFFSGAKKKAEEYSKTIEEYENLLLEKMDFNRLKDLLDTKFKPFYEEIYKFSVSLKKGIDRKKKEQVWEGLKKEKIKSLSDKNQELARLKYEVKKQDPKIISKLKREIELLENYITKNYSEFKYKESSNELENLKKTDNKKISFQNYTLPKYPIPEVGVLFEDKTSYYLEIEDYDVLDQANRLVKERYINKPAQVVVKES
ncbi:MAG: hypothetical protein JEZ04_21660 [Spirochaetales bacterium]|nr:hypothetical protein [Spirochaetales bacterium]